MSESPISPQPSDEQKGQSPPVNPATEAEVLGDLKRLYQPMLDRNAHSLERVRARLAAQQAHAANTADALHSPHAMERRGTLKEKCMRSIFPSFSQGGAWRRGIGTLAAIVVLVVLVGSMVAIFTLARSGNHGPSTAGSSQTGNPPPVTRTSTPSQGLGTTIYTSPASGDGFYAFAWSPDSKRVAASTMSQVQIWDATTGKHPLTYIPNGQGGSVLALSWSPDGTKLAVGAVSSDGLEIINSVTGKLLRVFNPGQAFQESGPGLAAAVSFNGGSGVSSTAWSPNGKLMATAFFGSAYGNKVVIWNPATGALVSSFTGYTNMISSVAWSADGVSVASTSLDGTVQVWNTSTKKVTFTKGAQPGSAVAWSPSGLQIVFSSDANTVQVWDVLTQKLITSYSASTYGELSWSPDGKAIAVASGNDVILWNAATGKLIYTYTQTGNPVGVLAWSPDGKYIISGGSNETGNNHAKVWTAAPLP